VHRRTPDREPAALVVLAPRRDEDPALAAQECPRDRARSVRDRLRDTLADDLTILLDAIGPDRVCVDRVVLEELSMRFPGLRLVPDLKYEFPPNVSFRGPQSLPVEWDA